MSSEYLKRGVLGASWNLGSALNVIVGENLATLKETQASPTYILLVYRHIGKS